MYSSLVKAKSKSRGWMNLELFFGGLTIKLFK